MGLVNLAEASLYQTVGACSGPPVRRSIRPGNSSDGRTHALIELLRRMKIIVNLGDIHMGVLK